MGAASGAVGGGNAPLECPVVGCQLLVCVRFLRRELHKSQGPLRGCKPRPSSAPAAPQSSQRLAMRAAAVQASAQLSGQASSRPAKPQAAPLAAVPAARATSAPRPHRSSPPRPYVTAGAAAVEVTQVRCAGTCTLICAGLQPGCCPAGICLPLPPGLPRCPGGKARLYRAAGMLFSTHALPICM